MFSSEPSYRGRGFGKEVTRMMMFYGEQLLSIFKESQIKCYSLNSNTPQFCCLTLGVAKLGIKTFQAKIGLSNEVSILMFKKLNFKEVIS